MKKAILILSFIIGVFFTIDAQVTGVHYLIEYNDTTGLYDCKIVINSGQATEYPDRIQFNCQYTFVVPSGTIVSIEEVHAPWENNATYTGTVPILWEIGLSEISPPVTPMLDYYSIIPNITPPSAYNDLYPGDTITIFSIAADLEPCENAIRLFENGVDPSSIDMPSGGDYSNGFTLGGFSQKYIGNLTPIYGDNSISSDDLRTICIGECTLLEPTLFCLEDSLKFEWSTGDTTETIEVCPSIPSNYYLLVKDMDQNTLDSIHVFVDLVLPDIDPDFSSVCAGSTITLESCPGNGAWTQSPANPFGASLSPLSGGIVEVTFYEISSGTYDFIYGIPGFTDTFSVTVNPSPMINIADSQICIGETTEIVSNTPEGDWSSNNPSIAIYNGDANIIMGESAGSATFNYTTPAGCTATSAPLLVSGGDNAEFIGPNEICVGSTTSVSPTTGGTWISSNPSVATVDNAGIVTGFNDGITSLIYINTASGCQSDALVLNVQAPNIELTGPNEICIGGTTTITPSTGGSWSSSDPSIATINNFGVITGISEGYATFSFTSSSTLCTSEPSDTVYVSTIDYLEIEDLDICVGETTQLLTDSEGTGYSDNPAIATVNYETRVVTGFSPGTVSFYWSNSSGCSISTYPTVLTVHPLPIIEFAGSSVVCVGEGTTLYSNTNGTWSSSNNAVATMDNIGNVTAIQPGIEIFTFTDAVTGCESEPFVITVIGTLYAPEPNNNSPLCEGEDLHLTTNEMSGASYEWTGPNGFTSNEQNPVVSDMDISMSGTYCLVVSIDGCISSEGCTDVIVNSIPATPIARNNGAQCEGENLNLTTESVSGATFSWTGPNGFTSTLQNPVIPVAYSTDSGVYCVTVSVNGCESMSGCTDVLIIPVPNTPFVSNNGPVCEEDDIYLTTDLVVGGIYEWSGPNGFTSTDQNPIITGANPTHSGSYCLIVTVENCVSEQVCIDVIIKPTPSSPTISSNSPICEGSDLEFSTSSVPGATYYWTGPDGYTSTNQNPIITSVTSANAGFYSVYNIVAGCQSLKVQTEIEISTFDLDLTISNSGPVCSGNNITLAIEEVSGATYQWSGPQGDIIGGASVTLTEGGTVTSGTYEVEVTLNNCTETNTTEVEFLENNEIEIANNTLCIGESTSLFPISGGSYTLSNSDLGVINGGNFTALNSGTSELFFTSDASGCESQAVTIIVLNCLEPAASCEDISADDIICDFNDLENVGGTLTDQNSEGNQPLGALCDDGDEAHNISWFGFVALEGEYDIVVNISNCTPFVGGVLGVQVGVYSECNFTEQNKIFCESVNESETQIRISSSMLTFGQTYFLYIDGFDESVCDYWIDVEGFYDNTYCTDLSKVTGVAYIDDNGNGIYELGETLLRNALISLFPGNFSVLTNNEGKYIINTPKGGATLTAKMNDGHWIDDELTIEDLTVFETCVEGINFGFVPNLFYQEANISVANTITRCDWETKFYFTVENTGTIDLDAKFEFAFDSKASYFATNLIGLQVAGDVASGDLGIIEPFEVREYWITLKMPSGSTVLPTLDFKTTLTNIEDVVMDEYEQSEQLRCSYDPNDKREYPDREGEENLTLMDEDIEYTIRFQNNGNDTAFQVKIIDPLDVNIDKTSIRVISSSHAVETCIENENLIFIFEDINLVDSMTNYDGSQGFVSYRCNAKAGRSENTIVHNTADIIFDTNVPIITNTTINTLVSELCTYVTNEIDIEICEGESFNGHVKSGTYTESHPLTFGCDSTLIINLEVQGITYSSQEIEICEGEIFEANGKEYELSESGMLMDTLQNALGCISNIFIFNVQVNPIQRIDVDTTICEGLAYDGLTESGIYAIESFDAVTGCDIITTIDLEVLSMSDPSCIVGTDDVISSEIKIYPIPARDVLYLEGDININAVSIFSVDYQKLKEVTFDNIGNKRQISTSDLSVGLYIVVVKSEDAIIYKKLIVE